MTPFGEAELTNAIELRVFRREITTAQARAALAKLAAHIADAVFQAAPRPYRASASIASSSFPASDQRPCAASSR